MAGNYTRVSDRSNGTSLIGVQLEEGIPLTDTAETRSSGWRKPVAATDINEIPPVESLEHKHSRNWSGSTAASIHEDVDDDADSKHPRSTKSNIFKFPYTESWFYEITLLCIGIFSVGAIIGILRAFNGVSLPKWPLSITLNTVIALLAAIANAALAVPLSSGLSQLKWARFKMKAAPLGDMELFDDASRGSWGAAKLLGKGRGGLIGSFGAIVTIIALVLGPFSQQVATYPTRSVISRTAATIPAAVNYTAALPGDSSLNGFVPILPMKAAVYNGLFAESGPALPAAQCETGNCTWDPFTTLAVCSDCIDLSPFMIRYCNDSVANNFSTCGWQLPQGSKLNDNKDVFSMTSFLPNIGGNMPYSDIIKLIFMGTEAQNGPPLNYNPWAMQCTLEYCAQNITSEVVNGKLSENVTSTIRNTTVEDITNSQGKTPVILTTGPNTSFFISEPATLGIQSWFSTIFSNGSASRDSNFEHLNTATLVVVNLTVGISSGTTYFDTDVVQTFYWDYYEYADGINKAMSDLATAMTVAFRSFNGAVPISGSATSTETYVKVRWVWITLPLFVVLGTTTFLIFVVIHSRNNNVELWKGSALAMLFYGLDSSTKIQFCNVTSFEDKKRLMKHTRVKLDEHRNFGSVLHS